MSKLKLTKAASGTMPTQALVDAVNECEGCNGRGIQPVKGYPHACIPCPECGLIRKALLPLTEPDDA